MKHKFPYLWNLADGYPAKGIEAHGLKVFGTFICGGGSTMGYKLAGFQHLGGVEIDPKIAEVYKQNHKPKYLYLQDLREFNKRQDLPKELFELDILDGSPPCSTFSMAGSREKAWGKSKQFREGQAKQTLDDLVYVYIDTIAKLKPKVAILENVSGIIKGNAKDYSKKIVSKLKAIGYDVQVFLLNAASMGVPQRRERVFFIASQRDLMFPKLDLRFNEDSIFYSVFEQSGVSENKKTDTQTLRLYNKTKAGDSFAKNNPNGQFYGYTKTHPQKVLSTIVSNNGTQSWHYKEYRTLSVKELIVAGTFPQDYNFGTVEPKYLIGMSVPPVMTAQIAHQIYLQWLK